MGVQHVHIQLYEPPLLSDEKRLPKPDATLHFRPSHSTLDGESIQSF